MGVFGYFGDLDDQLMVNPANIQGKGVIVGATICELHPEWMQSRLQSVLKKCISINKLVCCAFWGNLGII